MKTLQCKYGKSETLNQEIKKVFDNMILFDSNVKQFCLWLTAITGQSSEDMKEKVDEALKKFQYRSGCKSELIQQNEKSRNALRNNNCYKSVLSCIRKKGTDINFKAGEILFKETY